MEGGLLLGSQTLDCSAELCWFSLLVSQNHYEVSDSFFYAESVDQLLSIPVPSQVPGLVLVLREHLDQSLELFATGDAATVLYAREEAEGNPGAFG